MKLVIASLLLANSASAVITMQLYMDDKCTEAAAGDPLTDIPVYGCTIGVTSKCEGTTYMTGITSDCDNTPACKDDEAAKTCVASYVLGVCSEYAGSGGLMFIKYDGECPASPCFSRDATACRLLDLTAGADAAHGACFGAGGAAAERVSMPELSAGDHVLASPSEVTRVIVNQHKAAGGPSSTVVHLTHSTGSLALTPDHVIMANGAFVAARDVKVGSTLSSGATVAHVASAHAAVVNPLTSAGTILAAGPEGAPVLASVYPEWIHATFTGSLVPKYSLSATLARFFPASVQQYYDAVLEPMAAGAGALKPLKAGLPVWAHLPAVLVVDVAFSAGFAAHALAGPKALAALAIAAAAAAVARRAAK